MERDCRSFWVPQLKPLSVFVVGSAQRGAKLMRVNNIKETWVEIQSIMLRKQVIITGAITGGDHERHRLGKHLQRVGRQTSD